MKLLFALFTLFTLSLTVVLGAATPAAATGYDVICVQPVVNGAPVGPKICVAVPVEP